MYVNCRTSVVSSSQGKLPAIIPPMARTRAVTALSLSLLFLIAACGGDGEDNPFGVKSEVVTPADFPVSLAFAPDGRLFYAEQLSGNIRIVTADGELLPEPFAHIDTLSGSEWGLTGLAIDPDFESNHYVYAYFTQAVQTEPKIGTPAVVRLTDANNKGTEPRTMVGDMPESDPDHIGYNLNGRIAFGPDGFLYLSVGDYDSPLFNPQDLSMPLGKILRVNKEDGSPAPGNPFTDDPAADSRIFAYGFREPFPFAFEPTTAQLYGTDNTPVSCEELNIIESGGNYGYPDVGQFPFADCQFGSNNHGIYFFAKKDMQPESFLSNTYVSGLAFVSAAEYPSIGDALLVCESEKDTHTLRRLTLGGAKLDQVTASDIVVKDCNRDVAVSPDGTIFYSSDTEIRRLTFEPTPAEQ